MGPESASKEAADSLTCELLVHVNGREYLVGNQPVTLAGAERVLWRQPPEAIQAGMRVAVALSVPGKSQHPLKLAASFVQELTTHGDSWGLRFEWASNAPTEQSLKQWIAQWGAPGKDKRPPVLRANSANPAFPRTVTARLSNDSAFHHPEGLQHPEWSARIESLGGLDTLQLVAESELAARVRPGDGLHIHLQSRHADGFEIDCLAHVRAVLIYADPPSGALARSLTVHLEWIDGEQRELYQSLLRLIVDYAVAAAKRK